MALRRILARDGRESKTYGSPPRDSYIPLLWREPPLIVGEGPETVLSGIEVTGYGGVACMGGGRLGDFEAPPEVREVIVAVDNDEASLDELNKMAPRQSPKASLCGSAYTDEREGYDWNDALRMAETSLPTSQRRRSSRCCAGRRRGRRQHDQRCGRRCHDKAAAAATMADSSSSNSTGRAAHRAVHLAGGSTTSHGPGTGVQERASRYRPSTPWRVAAGSAADGWRASHPRKVIYFDGELSLIITAEVAPPTWEPTKPARYFRATTTSSGHLVRVYHCATSRSAPGFLRDGASEQGRSGRHGFALGRLRHRQPRGRGRAGATRSLRCCVSCA